MKDKWNLELTDEEWGLVYKALIHSNDTTLPNLNVKDIAKKIYKTRTKISETEKEKLISKFSQGYGV